MFAVIPVQTAGDHPRTTMEFAAVSPGGCWLRAACILPSEESSLRSSHPSSTNQNRLLFTKHFGRSTPKQKDSRAGEITIFNPIPVYLVPLSSTSFPSVIQT